MRFFEKWMIENNAYTCFECWDREGYHPERSDFPIDAQLVSVTAYSYSTILCDGFETFFTSQVGDFAPEVVATLDRMGFSAAASALKSAMQLVGGIEYPRTSDDRMIVPNATAALERLLVEFDFSIPNPSLFYDRCDLMLKAAVGADFQ